MKTFSYSQQQLLSVLQIRPLKLTRVFSTQPTFEVSDSATGIFEPMPLPAADLTSELAKDISLVLPEGVSWHIDAQIATVELRDKQLVTPDLAALQQANFKRVLWQLLSSESEN